MKTISLKKILEKVHKIVVNFCFTITVLYLLRERREAINNVKKLMYERYVCDWCVA